MFACFIEMLFGKLFILFLFYLFYFLFYCISYNKSFVLIQCDIFLEISDENVYINFQHPIRYSRIHWTQYTFLPSIEDNKSDEKIKSHFDIDNHFVKSIKKKQKKENNYLFNPFRVLFGRFLINPSLMSRSTRNERRTIVTDDDSETIPKWKLVLLGG